MVGQVGVDDGYHQVWLVAKMWDLPYDILLPTRYLRSVVGQQVVHALHVPLLQHSRNLRQASGDQLLNPLW